MYATVQQYLLGNRIPLTAKGLKHRSENWDSYIHHMFIICGKLHIYYPLPAKETR